VSASLASYPVGLLAEEMRIRQRLSPKRVGRATCLPTPPYFFRTIERPLPDEEISAIKKWKTKFGGDRDKKDIKRNNIRSIVL